MRSRIVFWCVCCCQISVAQVDTAFVYNPNTPYGALDIRIAKSPTHYYYLEEGKTFSFRESPPGVKTNTYRDMTSWDSSPYQQGNLRERKGDTDYFVMNYRLLFPGSYQASYAEGYPLIISLHGAGSPANCWEERCYWASTAWNPRDNIPMAPISATSQLLNNDKQLNHSGREHLKARNLAEGKLPDDPTSDRRAFPGFVLVPQNLNGWDILSAQDAIRLIRIIVKKYAIDPNRIYIHGISNGGVGTYQIVKRAPWLFAAAMPMSAPSDAGVTDSSVVDAISEIPFRIFQGGADPSPSPAKTRQYINALQDAGAVIRYDEYDGIGHDLWSKAIQEPDYYAWMLSQNKSNIHVFGGVTSICPTTGQGVRMSLSRGFHTYQWEFNGQIIPDANTSSFVANKPGVYRARFSRVPNPNPGDWNQWSKPVTVTMGEEVIPKILHVGTVLLKDLNNANTAKLKAVGDFSHYYWYRDGALLDLPGLQDDTTKNLIINAGPCTESDCEGNGTYTLVVAGPDQCPGLPSQSVRVVFNDLAPVRIAAPKNFTGYPLEDGRVKLDWQDVSFNETGFELWRRRKTGDTSFTKWELATLAGTDTESFTDQGLIPSAVYQYKIRAVGNGIRSAYTPDADGSITVEMLRDLTKPTPPHNVLATTPGLRLLKLSWIASSDNTGIKEYIIDYGSAQLSTGSGATEYTFRDLPLNTKFTFTVYAKDLDGNLSPPSQPVVADTYVKGLHYKHTTGVFENLDNIDWSFVEYRGTAENFDLSKRVQDEYFNFSFEGYLYIRTGGMYTFELVSDEGSRLAIDDQVVVDHDGIHLYSAKKSPPVYLTEGAHLLNCKYFELSGDEALTVRYQGPDTYGIMIEIPAQALSSRGAITLWEMRELLAELRPYGNPNIAMPKKEAIPEGIFNALVYPNPATAREKLSIALTLDKPVRTQVQIVDLVGQSYYNNTWEAGTAGTIEVEPARTMYPGIYVVIITVDGVMVRRKVVVK